jgi:hypothetical protein
MLADEPTPSGGPLPEGMSPSPPAATAALAESREQTDGHLALKRHWRALGGAGQVALLVSAALLLCFSLPWYSLPDYYGVPRNPFPTLSATGWSTALGSPHTLWDSPLVLFPELWLVPLSALGLLGTVFLILRGRWPPQRAFSVLLAAAGVTLFAELGFFLEVQSLQAGFVHSLGGPLLDLQGNTGCKNYL